MEREREGCRVVVEELLLCSRVDLSSVVVLPWWTREKSPISARNLQRPTIVLTLTVYCNLPRSLLSERESTYWERNERSLCYNLYFALRRVTVKVVEPREVGYNN